MAGMNALDQLLTAYPDSDNDGPKSPPPTARPPDDGPEEEAEIPVIDLCDDEFGEDYSAKKDECFRTGGEKAALLVLKV
jgi:hypothetical protein